MSEKLGTLIYDGGCGLCRTFAAFASKSMASNLEAISWQDFRVTQVAKQHFNDEEISRPDADSLYLLTNEAVLKDTAAWAWMLKNQPDLKTIGWLAQKLHLEEATASGLAKAGRFLRRRCAWCRPW